MQAELAHKSSDGADARDGFVTVSGSDFGVFRPFPREPPSAKSLSLGETRLTGGAVVLGSWRFESSRPSSAVQGSPVLPPPCASCSAIPHPCSLRAEEQIL